MSFKVLESSSREEWLEQRRHVLTATDMATLYSGGPKAWARVAESKKEQPDDFDNAYMQWGREREPVIAGYINTFIDSQLQPNDQLIVSLEDSRFAATPDMIAVDSVGDVTIAEIKTSKHDLTDIPTRYMVQMQWQMLVTKAEWCIFAWEQHEDFVPIVQPKHVVVFPDPKMFAEMRKIAEQFFSGEPASDVHSVKWRRLLHEWKLVDEQEQHVKSAKEWLRGEMEQMMGDDDFTFKSPAGSVSYTLPKPRVTFDAKAFKAEHPDMYQNFVKQSEPTGRTLRVTLPEENE